MFFFIFNPTFDTNKSYESDDNDINLIEGLEEFLPVFNPPEENNSYDLVEVESEEVDMNFSDEIIDEEVVDMPQIENEDQEEFLPAFNEVIQPEENNSIGPAEREEDGSERQEDKEI